MAAAEDLKWLVISIDTLQQRGLSERQALIVLEPGRASGVLELLRGQGSVAGRLVQDEWMLSALKFIVAEAEDACQAIRDYALPGLGVVLDATEDSRVAQHVRYERKDVLVLLRKGEITSVPITRRLGSRAWPKLTYRTVSRELRSIIMARVPELCVPETVDPFVTAAVGTFASGGDLVHQEASEILPFLPGMLNSGSTLVLAPNHKVASTLELIQGFVEYMGLRDKRVCLPAAVLSGSAPVDVAVGTPTVAYKGLLASSVRVAKLVLVHADHLPPKKVKSIVKLVGEVQVGLHCAKMTPNVEKMIRRFTMADNRRFTRTVPDGPHLRGTEHFYITVEDDSDKPHAVERIWKKFWLRRPHIAVSCKDAVCFAAKLRELGLCTCVISSDMGNESTARALEEEYHMWKTIVVTDTRMDGYHIAVVDSPQSPEEYFRQVAIERQEIAKTIVSVVKKGDMGVLDNIAKSCNIRYAMLEM